MQTAERRPGGGGVQDGSEHVSTRITAAAVSLTDVA
jgi:hypothetical protein